MCPARIRLGVGAYRVMIPGSESLLVALMRGFDLGMG